MEFVFETIYNQKAMATMARALRKTLRKKRNLRSHILGWIIVVLRILLAWPISEGEVVIEFRTIITWLAVLVIAIVLIWEDQINGYMARKRMLAGTDKAASVFTEEGYSSTTEVGKSEWNYDKVFALAETDEYFVFIFSASHAQVYDKQSLSGGTAEEFRTFVEKKTGKKIEKIR